MRIENSYKIIPCYTADVSGVCSALFELGGMVVMHDPSGCNSTYNTHDETRWYDNDSLIYITGLTEMDAIMGNDKKVVDDISDAAKRLSPRFIALCGSPIPFINGTDYKALAVMIEKKTGITTFDVETNGTHDYVQGAGPALLKYAERVMKPAWDRCFQDRAALTHSYNSDEQAPFYEVSEKEAKAASSFTVKSAKGHGLSVNILGATPLDFAEENTLYSLRNVLAGRDINIISIFSMLGGEKYDHCRDNVRPGGENPENWRKIYSSWDEEKLHNLENAVFADVNLVISAVGYKLARFMYDCYGIPYVIGLPVGEFTDKLCMDIKKAADCKSGRLSYADRNLYCTGEPGKNKTTDDAANQTAAVHCNDNSAEIAIIGEPVTSGSIAAAITLKYGKRVSVLCPLEKCEPFLCEGDHSFKGEVQCIELMKKFKHVIADPLYLPICPETVNFHRLPHEAFSGRCCWSEMKNLVTLFDD